MLIVVNTNLDRDEVNADGGLMSLREAIRLADATPGADQIVFDPAAFAGGFNRIDMDRDSTLPTAAATTSNAFRITSGDGLTINGDFDGDGLADVEIFGGGLTVNGVFSVTPHFEIAAGAAVTLEALELTGGGMAVLAPAEPGGAATGANRSPAGADGRDAYGSILNEGTLTLDRVRINDTLAIAQDGGDGGQGGAGGPAPDGFDGTDGALFVVATAGGDGFDGNEGADGGRGGKGGSAAGAILNRGDLTVIDSAFGPNLRAEAGDGGNGGKGGRGGSGGDGGTGGDGFVAVVFNTSAKEGGDGGSAGRPGSGGRGGDGGDAAAGILNIGGSVTFETALAQSDQVAPVIAGTAGAAGGAGDRGTAGSGGDGGEQTFGGRAASGSAGGRPFAFSSGFPGDPGAASDLVIGETAPATAETLVFARALAEEATEGEEIAFAIGRIDSFFVGILDVEWRAFVGVGGISLDESDFAEGTEFSGSVRLSGANNGAVIRLPTVVDGAFEASETVAFTIESVRVPGGDPLVTTGTVATRLLSDFAADLAEDNDLTARFEDGDTLEGGGGNDTLRGGPGGDLLLGGEDDDLLLGGGGSDTLHGGPGVNRIEGGGGQDEAVFEGAFADYAIEAAQGGLRLSRAGETTTVLEVETFRFADGARSLAAITPPVTPPPEPPVTPPTTPPVTPPVSPPTTPPVDPPAEPPVSPPTTPPVAPRPTTAPAGPTQGDDNLRGTGGPERIAALRGDDTVRGLGGDDTLLGQGGEDRLLGQGGNDVLRGGGGDDSLKGGGGADRMFGQAADDTLKGGGAGDFMKGGGGDDRLIGGGGADTIEGNKGDDTLKGGGGADLFRFKPGDGDDVIQRFQQGRDQVEFKRGVADFDDLRIEQQGGDVLVSYTRGSILFQNQNAGAFGEDDFIF